ncbi:hypothetical protein B0H12DRAFT_1161820 [Mycena haematopus]|nr:hypothetical protein B0H12DRAFT_1161820 [Mycena haematopus]
MNRLTGFAELSYPVPGMETDGLDADGTAGSGTGLRRESSKCRRCGLSREHYGA